MFRAEVGTFTSPTTATTKTVSLSNFGGDTPKLIRIWTTQQTADGVTTDALFGMGLVVSTSSRAAIAASNEDGGSSCDEQRYHNQSAAIVTLNAAGTVVELADLDSVAADEFVLDFTTASASEIQYHFAAYGGDDLEVSLLNVIADTTPGDQVIAHGLSGTPTALMAMSVHALGVPPGGDSAGETGLSFGVSDLTNHRTSSTYLSNCSAADGTRAQLQKFLTHSQEITIVEEAVVSADDTNITITWEKADSAEYYYLVALRGVIAEVGTFTSPTAAGNKTISTDCEQLKAFEVFGVMDTSQTWPQDNARIMFGASDGTNNASAGIMNKASDGDRYNSSDKILAVYDHAQALAEEAAVTEFDGADATLNFSTADANENEWYYLALGTDPTSGVIFVGGPDAVDIQITAWKDIR